MSVGAPGTDPARFKPDFRRAVSEAGAPNAASSRISLRIFQNDVAPEHHGLAPRGNLPVDLLEKIKINPAPAFCGAQFPASTFAQIPSLIAADVEKAAGKIRQQFVVKTPQEGQGAGMIRGQRGRTAEKVSGLGFVRLGQLAELFQSRVGEKIAQMPERILVRHEVNAQARGSARPGCGFPSP